MRRSASFFPAAALATTLTATPALAQEAPGAPGADGTLASSAALEAAVLEHTAEVERTRADLDDFLATEVVAEVARDRGVSLERVRTAAGAMTDAQVRATAPLLERAREAAQGGGTITISVYTVIIILLLLILLT